MVLEMQILRIQPSQFFISEKKIAQIKKWFQPDDLSNFDPIPVKMLNDKLIFTDGHTRAFVAWSAGMTKIPVVWDLDELDWEAYQICADACIKRGIKNIADLADRVLPDAEYQRQWDGWCDVLQEVLELQRNRKR